MSMTRTGDSLVDIATNAVLEMYPLGDDQVKVPNDSGYTWENRDFDDGTRKIVEAWTDDAQDPALKPIGSSTAYNGTIVVTTIETTPKTQEELDAEARAQAQQDLEASDQGLVRAIEDLTARQDEILAAMTAGGIDTTAVSDIDQAIRDKITARLNLRIASR